MCMGCSIGSEEPDEVPRQDPAPTAHPTEQTKEQTEDIFATLAVQLGKPLHSILSLADALLQDQVPPSSLHTCSRRSAFERTRGGVGGRRTQRS